MFLQQQVLYLSGRLDEVKSQLSESESREVHTLDELEKMRGERDTLTKTMESDLQRKGKALEQTRAREDKLIHKLQHVCN